MWRSHRDASKCNGLLNGSDANKLNSDVAFCFVFLLSFFFSSIFRTNWNYLLHSLMARALFPIDATSFIRPFVNILQCSTESNALTLSRFIFTDMAAKNCDSKKNRTQSRRRRQWKCISGFYARGRYAKHYQCGSQVALQQSQSKEHTRFNDTNPIRYEKDAREKKYWFLREWFVVFSFLVFVSHWFAQFKF